MTIHVVIDSTEYKGDPFRYKSRFQAIRRLAEAGVVKLHMPYVVKGELLSHMRTEFQEVVDNEKGLRKGIEVLDALNASNPVQDLQDIKEMMAGLRVRLEGAMERYNQHFTHEVDGWLAALGAETYGIEADIAKNAFDAYFTGTAPFPGPKLRDHLPDAFIYSQVKEIFGNLPVNDELCFVSNDKNLRTKVQEIDNGIRVFEFLHHFFKHGPVLQALHATNKYVTVNKGVIQQALVNNSANIQQTLFGSLSQTLTTKDLRVHGMPIGGSDSSLNDVNLNAPFTINVNELEDLGEGVILFSANLDIECELTAWIDKREVGEFVDRNDVMFVDIVDEDEYTDQVSFTLRLGVEVLVAGGLNIQGAKEANLTQAAADAIVRAAEFKIEEILCIGT